MAQASVDRLSMTANGAAINADGDLSVTNSTFVSNTSYGISVNGSPSLLVLHSKFIRNTHAGIYGPSALGAVIAGNVFTRNVALESMSELKVQDAQEMVKPLRSRVTFDAVMVMA